jgi:hypothetical protein
MTFLVVWDPSVEQEASRRTVQVVVQRGVLNGDGASTEVIFWGIGPKAAGEVGFSKHPNGWVPCLCLHFL